MRLVLYKEVGVHLVVAVEAAERALGRGDAPSARILLTGLEPRLLAADLARLIPRFFRLAAECERQDGRTDEAARLCRKGLSRARRLALSNKPDIRGAAEAEEGRLLRLWEQIAAQSPDS